MIENICGLEINLELKKIKNINLYILPPEGKIKVTAPLRTSRKRIENFIADHYEWIKSKQTKVKSRNKSVTENISELKKIYILGKAYPLIKSLTTDKENVVFDGNTFTVYIKSFSDIEHNDKLIIEWMREYLYQILKVYVPKWENITGLKCSQWSIKKMKTRHGSCNVRTNKIWLSLWLVTKPIQFIEYVILHELAHTRVPNHGIEFKELVSRFMPDYKQIEKNLT